MVKSMATDEKVIEPHVYKKTSWLGMCIDSVTLYFMRLVVDENSGSSIALCHTVLDLCLDSVTIFTACF